MRASLQSTGKAILLIIFFILSGCASVSPKSTPLTDEQIQSNKGDFQGLYNSWLKPQMKNGKMDVTDLNSQKSTEIAISIDSERFCKSIGGKFEVLPYKFGRKNVCGSANGEYWGEIETKRFDEGLAVYVDSRELRRQREQARFAQADQQRKQDYEKLKLGSLSLDELNRLISDFENDDPQNLIPKARLRRDSLVDENRRVAEQRWNDRIRQMEAQKKARELKNVGDRICYSNSSSYANLPTGILVYGQPQYQRVEGDVRVSGFVERLNGMKIQIRISNIMFTDRLMRSRPLDSLSDFHGDTIHNGSVVWDDTHSWDVCDK